MHSKDTWNKLEWFNLYQFQLFIVLSLMELLSLINQMLKLVIQVIPFQFLPLHKQQKTLQSWSIKPLLVMIWYKMQDKTCTLQLDKQLICNFLYYLSGIKSKSWKTALTHFSQRYKSAKEIVEPTQYKLFAKKYDYALNHTIVCFDHMQMRLSETPKLPHISRAIASIIPNEKTDEWSKIFIIF